MKNMILRNLEAVKIIQKEKNIKGLLEISNRKGKRFMITINKDGQKYKIHFGSWPFTNGTFIDHFDEKKRKAWQARHKEIKLSTGEPAYLNELSPEYYSWNLLWA